MAGIGQAGLGLYVGGKLDLEDNEVAREAWRSMKDNRVGLSFGYMTVKNRRRDGINNLLELDLYEISIAPGPINPETRFLSLKATAEQEQRELRELRRRSDDIALDAALGWEPPPKVTPEPAKPVPTEAELRRQSAAIALELALGGRDPHTGTPRAGG